MKVDLTRGASLVKKVENLKELILIYFGVE